MTEKTKPNELTAKELESVQGGIRPVGDEKDRSEANLAFLLPIKRGHTGTDNSQPPQRPGQGRWIEGVYVFDESY